MRKGIALGRVLSDDGNTDIVTQQEEDLLVQSGAKVARVELRLGSAHPTWDDVILFNYRQVVLSLQAAGLQVVGLLNSSLVSGSNQAQWNANNTENNPGAVPTNPFVDSYEHALAQVILALGDVVTSWEIWNEPNAWSTRSGTVYSGSSYIYPSIYATLLARADAVITGLYPGAQVITGGLFGQDAYGVNQDSSGATYFNTLCKQLAARGAGHTAPWPWSSVGQHLYLDQGGLLVPAHATTYLDYLSTVLGDWSVPLSQQGILVTEAGWTTRSVPPATQASDLTDLFTACATRSFVTDVYWFLCWDNDAAGKYYGLCVDVTASPPLAPKPAYAAFQAVT